MNGGQDLDHEERTSVIAGRYAEGTEHGPECSTTRSRSACFFQAFNARDDVTAI